MLRSKDINWDGNAIFENGRVIGFKQQKPSNNYYMRPIPSSRNAIQDAREGSKVLAGMMRPVTKDQLADTFKRLNIHVGKQKKTPAEINSMTWDYYNDLSQYPIKLIEDACKTYRKAPGGNEFMPKSGKLIELMSAKWHKMKLMKVRIDKILGVHEEKKPRQNIMVSLDDALNGLM